MDISEDESYLIAGGSLKTNVVLIKINTTDGGII